MNIYVSILWIQKPLESIILSSTSQIFTASYRVLLDYFNTLFQEKLAILILKNYHKNDTCSFWVTEKTQVRKKKKKKQKSTPTPPETATLPS